MALQLDTLTNDELQTLFRNNLVGLVGDQDIKKHLVTLMVRSIRSEMLAPFHDPNSAYLRLEKWVSDSDSRQAYEKLMNLGDAYLWFVGFYPDYLTVRNKSLAIPDYIGVGKAAYDYAVYAGNKVQNPQPPVSAAYSMGNYFTSAARALFGLRSRLDVSVVLISPGTAQNISEQLFSGQPLIAQKKHEMPSLRLVAGN